MKLRSDQVRQKRMRWGALALGVMLGTASGLYVLWCAGDWALNRMVYQNQAFAIREVDVQTDGVIAKAQLRHWANVKPGENLLALDLVRVKRNLERIPFIAAVSVERILPKTLRLRVTEREAVAQVNVAYPRIRGGVDGRPFHLDPEGFLMPRMAPRQRAAPLDPKGESLPELTGVSLANLPLGRRVESAQVAAGLRLISEFDSSPMTGLVDLRRIDVSAPDVLVVTTGQGSEVTFGLHDLERQLRRWREIYDKVPQLKSHRVALDLAVSNNIPLHSLEADSLPAPTPKLPKPPRSKKRHV